MKAGTKKAAVYEQWCKSYKLTLALNDPQFLAGLKADNQIALISAYFLDDAQRMRAQELFIEAGVEIELAAEDRCLVALIVGSEVVECLSSPQPVYLDKLVDDTLFEAGGATGVSLTIDGMAQQTPASGMSIAVYERITGKTLCVRSFFQEN